MIFCGGSFYASTFLMVHLVSSLPLVLGQCEAEVHAAVQCEDGEGDAFHRGFHDQRLLHKVFVFILQK